ncbi:MAG TPA: hypothetical protein VFY52_03290 [Thermoleophilaceae bacterium]|nr:hypothetical protein [Thermoleophilaceae bacterium]
MLLALLVLALIGLVLATPIIVREAGRWRERRAARRPPADPLEMPLYDPGRERRAEQRARELLRSCVNDEEWAMYRDLGFIRVGGRHARREADRTAAGGAAYAYLVYPHKPIVAYVPGSGRLLSEYCVEFPDLTGSGGRHRLPASDDVLAKWMALTSDEDRVIRRANMHLVGRQLDPARVRRDLWRLAEWERRRRRGDGEHSARPDTHGSGGPKRPARPGAQGWDSDRST